MSNQSLHIYIEHQCTTSLSLFPLSLVTIPSRDSPKKSTPNFNFQRITVVKELIKERITKINVISNGGRIGTKVGRLARHSPVIGASVSSFNYLFRCLSDVDLALRLTAAFKFESVMTFLLLSI